MSQRLAEVDQLLAVFPELKSARSRIKARYVPKQRDLELFYPPKWGLEVKLAGAGNVLSKAG